MPGRLDGWADYEAERTALDELQARETEALYDGWTQRVNVRGEQAGTPPAGVVDVNAGEAREATRARMAAGEAKRAARGGAARTDVRAGQAEVEGKVGQPLTRHVIESVPGVGERVAGKLFGTAANAAPDASRQADASRRADAERADQ